MARTIDDPRNARSRRTRDALLAATRAILETEGFEALTMTAVAERAGITRRAVYLHFNSRTELVSALFDYLAEREGLAESTDPIRAAPDAVTALRAWVRHLATYHPRLLAVDRAIERVRHTDADAARHREAVTEAQLANCRWLAERLAAENRLAPHWTVRSATDMLWGLISTDLFERMLTGRGWSQRRLEKHLQALYLSTFVQDPPP
ncbi:TetR/AcrR family transcriptional regulator [Amycolatopsis cihanbeyliensis]|uniref:TetR family transcriptional regulator n=1 Tax=Amycolatopsis cihanbeyliensis TaxID=1128664 RepID=A0A542DFE9_AMYCI|nr:TetR/AcrR family transcriptional regulator [Amycolatopsis cihanbeyliensis]TQJ01793.1 TetR family transcriptional regulator [Amycolatopsis cihanbeyliensis]